MKKFARPAELYTSNYFATVDSELCEGCETCVDRCQMDALAIEDEVSTVNLDRCIGCGLCVPTCPSRAIHLESNGAQMGPPDTRQDLYDVIMARKKGQWGKLKLTGKLFVDAVRTGRTDLLK